MADTTVATNEIAVDEAALSGHIHNTLPVVDMNAVFDTVLVKIVVGDQSKYVKAFTVPREQVCASSTTLKSASKSVFQETDSKVFALQDYQPAAFAVFLEYIYTLKIGLTWPTTGLDFPDLRDTLTWSWKFLFECYALGDYLGASQFRQEIFESLQYNCIVDPCHVSAAALHYLYDNTPESSKLRRLIVLSQCAFTFKGDHSVDEDGEAMPAQWLSDCLNQKSKQVSALKCSLCNCFVDVDEVLVECPSTSHSFRDVNVDLVRDWCVFS